MMVVSKTSLEVYEMGVGDYWASVVDPDPYWILWYLYSALTKVLLNQPCLVGWAIKASQAKKPRPELWSRIQIGFVLVFSSFLDPNRIPNTDPDPLN